MPEETKKEILKTNPSSYLSRRHLGAVKASAKTRRQQHAASRRVWVIVGVFLVALALLIAGLAVYARRQSERLQAANHYESQPLAEATRISLLTDTVASADYLIIPDSSGTVAVSASGPLVLDAKGNLSCPSCVTGVVPSSTTLVEQITNNYTTVEAITNNYSSLEQITNNYITNTYDTLSVSAGAGIAINEVDGEYIISASGVANESLSNLTNVALNTHLLPATSNGIDVGSGVVAFRSGYYGTSVHTPTLDTLLAGQLTIGMSAATSVLLGADTIMATGKSLAVNGAALFKNDVNSASAFQIQDSAGAALLNANTSQGTLSVGTYVPTVVWSTASVTRTDYVTGANPQGVTKADVNGDGKADLITSNISSNTVSVFINNGNGTFAAKVDYTTGVNPRGVTSADFNGDGKPDLAVGNWGSNTLSILMNNGNGTFAAKVDYAAGSKAQHPTSADFNGDGLPDVAVARADANAVSVFINNGNGTFAAKVDYVTGGAGVVSWAVTAADFNADGKADLAVTNSATGTVSVFINNGNGTFAAKVDYATGGIVYGVTSADFNADGKADLVVTNVTPGNTLSVFLNNGNGTFATKVDYATGANSSPFSVIAADLNSDSKVDLAVANNNSNTVSVFAGNGNGTFAAKVDYATGSGPSVITNADFNNDGVIDLATANSGGSNMSVLLFGVTTGTPVAQVASKLVVNTSANAVGQIIQGTAGQTADLLQVRDDLNKTLFSIGSTGSATAASALNVAGTFTGTGTALFKNAIDSGTAFQVQQASGTSVFSIDTGSFGGRVGIGTAAPGNKLSVNVLATGDTTAQVAISTGANNNKGLLIQGVSGQSVDLLQAKSSTGTVLASISATGILTVASAVVSGNITISGHIITSGTTPVIAANTAACTAPTVNIVGNDTSGTVTVTTGTGCGVAGSLVTITFNTAFGSAPRIILTANNANAANLNIYSGSATTTAFTIDSSTVPTDTTIYKLTYWTVQ